MRTASGVVNKAESMAVNISTTGHIGCHMPGKRLPRSLCGGHLLVPCILP